MMLQICSVVVMKIASIYWIWQAKQMEKETWMREGRVGEWELRVGLSFDSNCVDVQ